MIALGLGFGWPSRFFISLRSQFPSFDSFRSDTCSDNRETIEESSTLIFPEMWETPHGQVPIFMSFITICIISLEGDIYPSEIIQLCACDTGVDYNSYCAAGKHFWMSKYVPCQNPKPEPKPWNTIQKMSEPSALTTGTTTVVSAEHSTTKNSFEERLRIGNARCHWIGNVRWCYWTRIVNM